MDFPPVQNMVSATFNQLFENKEYPLNGPQAPQPASDSSGTGSNSSEGSGPQAAVTTANSNPSNIGTVLNAEA